METKIMEVTKVSLEILKKNPPILQINSSGKVNTGGWTNGQLSAFVYVTPPQDGIYEFDFVADPPSGVSPSVISDIYATPFEWQDFPNELKGVKVYSSSNSITEDLTTNDAQ